MKSKVIERFAAVLGSATILATTVLAGSCAQIIGVEDLPPQDSFTVRGVATGVLGPVALELRIDGDSELLTVTEDRPFSFETRLDDDASYTVVFVDSNVPCTLLNQTGVINGADTAIELTCTGASLASLAVSAVESPSITLESGGTDYAVDLSLLQQSVTVMATVATPGDTLSIAGTPVVSGEPSAPVLLNLGDNPVEIVVENALGWKRTYHLTLRRGTQFAQYAYGKAYNTGAGDRFGDNVALYGDTLVIGAQFEDSAGKGVNTSPTSNSAMDSGAVYVFRRSGTAWAQEAYLKASNTDVGDRFGHSVALWGDTLAVGAIGEDGGATSSGAVYVFRRSGTTWQQEAYIKSSVADPSALFGNSLALSGDVLAVGAWFGDGSSDTVDNSGLAYVFRRTGTTWQQEAKIQASNAGVDDHFGYSVALSGDTLAISATAEDSAAKGVDGAQNDNSATDSGAVYVFRHAGASWQQEAYLKASNTDAGDNFGFSLALSGDTLVVGARFEDSAVADNQDDNTAMDSGAVYVFRRFDTVWQQEAYLKASNTGAGDNFGNSVAISGDTLVVGAPYEDSTAISLGGDQAGDAAMDSGAVYIFRWTGTAWQQAAYLKASNTGASDNFGQSVALSGDTLAVGASLEDSSATTINGDPGEGAADSGAVYIFH
jgi:hypothetical protein